MKLKGNDMKLLVTGGAGFIGSNFIRYIFARHPDWQVSNLDKLTYAGNLENLKDIEKLPGYNFVRGDIADRACVDTVLKEKYDGIVNFAAESHVDRSILDASPFVDTNFKGTQVMLEGAREHGVTRFVQVSTDEVYGSREEGYFTEESNLDPSSPYSASKAAADLMCIAYHKTHRLPVMITRCTNNYGPYQFPEKLIPLVISNALEDKAIPVYGDGLYRRDWIYAEDHCRALEAVLLKGRAGQVYNIAGGQEKPNIELIKLILKALHKPEGLITFVKDRPAHDRRYAIDCGKIERELGWKPLYTLEKAMAATVDWYINNEPWWRNIKSGEYEKYYQRMYSGR
jgi:dTDP-glucose 4,6-dehydratase